MIDEGQNTFAWKRDNESTMGEGFEDAIVAILIMINSSIASAQNRKRLYFTNISDGTMWIDTMKWSGDTKPAIAHFAYFEKPMCRDKYYFIIRCWNYFQNNLQKMSQQ